MDEITYRPIGVIHSPFTTPEGTPIQPAAARGVRGHIELLPEYVAGLKDLEGFSHIILLYHFHLSGEYNLTVKPFLDEEMRGLFATRAPVRPNPIGLSTVRLLGIQGNRLLIQDVDILDGTPLLDIKPYVRDFDPQEDVKEGWFQKNLKRLPNSSADGRFTDP
jgi:tRNA-Thr(GGU) m(6)t(6)A37 methyltransferase TsaA